MKNKKRELVEKRILEVITTMEPSKTNTNKYIEMFNKMSNDDFDIFMNNIKEKKDKLKLFIPNMKVTLEQKNLLKTADLLNLKLFERIILKDKTTGKTYKTPLPYIVLKLPIRRTKQYLDHKLSVAEGDRKVDNLTGQVIKPDRASSMTMVEAQLLHSRSLGNSLLELMKVRGGDLPAFNTFKQNLEESGDFSLDSLDDNSIPRSALLMSVLLKCMYIDNNLIGDDNV